MHKESAVYTETTRSFSRWFLQFVIMIGLAALSIVVFQAVRTGEADLRDISILYLCVALVLVVKLQIG